MNLKFIEVCSGAGGLSQGFIQNGFLPVLLNDTDKFCYKTLMRNHPNSAVYHGSMKDINLDNVNYKNIDVLMGGVPCQSFSMAGKRKGVDDSRGELILYFVKMVTKLKPKLFLIENVKGSINQKYKQIGNAVPVNLSKALANEVKKTLSN